MTITTNQIASIVHRTMVDLSPGSRDALIQVLALINSELQSVSEAPVILESASASFPNGFVAVADGALTITPDTPTAGDIEFSA